MRARGEVEERERKEERKTRGEDRTGQERKGKGVGRGEERRGKEERREK